MRQWLDGVFQMRQLGICLCGCSRAKVAASNCSKTLPKPALTGVPGALEAVQLFILQHGYNCAVISCEESDHSLVLEVSSGWLERLYIIENPAFGEAGMLEGSCPLPNPEFAPVLPVPWPEVR